MPHTLAKMIENSLASRPGRPGKRKAGETNGPGNRVESS